MTIELINQYGEKRTVYPLDRDILIPHPFNLNDTLQHLDGQINCAIPYDPEIHKFLVENTFLKSKVYNEESQTIFTGVVKDGLEWMDNGTPEPLNEISLTLQDNGYYLNNTPEEDITYINQSLTTILADICKRCDLQIGSNLPTATISVAQIKQNTTYLNFINDILFQHCYAFGFDANGVLQTINIKEMETSEVFDDFFTGLKFTKTTKNYNAIHLNYGELTVKQNEQVYFEGGEIASDNTIQPIIIQPNAYYPPEATPIIEERDGKVIQNFLDGFAQTITLFNGEKKYQRSKNTELIYTENHVVTKDYSDNLTLDRTDFTATSASVRFFNNSATDAELYQLAIRATAYYRRPKKLILGEGKKFEYEAIYIYDSQRASTFANFLSKYFLGGNYKIAARTEKNFLPGSKLTLKTGISGIATRAIVISSTYNPREQNYNITFLTESDLALSPKFYQDRHTSQFPGPKGDKGDTGSQGPKGDKGDTGKNAITMTSSATPNGEYNGQIGIWQGQMYQWNGTDWVLTSGILPTDPILHYSFDELPDLPDGTNNFTGVITSAIQVTKENIKGGCRFTLNGGDPYVHFETNIGAVESLAVGYRQKAISKTGGVYSREAYLFYTDNSYSNISNFIPVPTETENIVRTIIPCDKTKTVAYIRLDMFIGEGHSAVIDVTDMYIGKASYTTPIIDNSGNNNNTTTTRGIVVDGINNKGLFLDKQALGRRFKMPSDFTVSLWCKAENDTKGLIQNILTTNNDVFIIRNGASWGDFLMYYVFTLKEDGSYDKDCRPFLPNGGLLPANEWVNLAITKKDNIIKCYYNGELKNIDTRETGSLLYHDYLTIGTAYNTRAQTIDDFQIFDRPLSDQEVLGLYLARGNTPKQYTKADYNIDQAPVLIPEITPKYLGPFNTEAGINALSKNIGDWLLFTGSSTTTYQLGQVYRWNGQIWEIDNNDGHRAQTINDCLALLKKGENATTYASQFVDLLVSQEVLAEKMSALEVRFQNFVASFKEKDLAAGDEFIYMGKNPLNPKGFEFSLGQFFGKSNNYNLYKNLFKVENNNGLGLLKTNGKIIPYGGVDCYSDIYAMGIPFRYNLESEINTTYRYITTLIEYKKTTYVLLKASQGFWVLEQTEENNGIRGIDEIHGPVTFDYGNFIDAVVINDIVYVVFSTLIGKLDMSTCTVTSVKTGSFSKVIWLDSTEQYMILQNRGNSFFLDSRGLTSTTITGSGVAEISADFIVSNKVQSGASFTAITVYDRDGKELFSKSVSGKKMYYTNGNTGTSSMFFGLTGTEGVLIASDSSARIFKSFDFGETWNQIQGADGLNITSYTRKGFVVLQTEYGSWFSNDNFNTVQALFSGDLSDAQLTIPTEFHRNGKIAGIKMITVADNLVDICEVPKISLTEQKRIIEDYYLSDADTGTYGRRYYLRLGENFCIQYGNFPLYDITGSHSTTVTLPFKLHFRDDSCYVFTANCINATNMFRAFSCEITQVNRSATSVTLSIVVSGSSLEDIPAISIDWIAVGAPA